MERDPNVTRYLDPEYCIRTRLGDCPRPVWPAAVLLFRDLPTSRRLLGLFDSPRPVEGRAFYNLGYEDQQPGVFEAVVGTQPVAIATGCVWGGPQTAILIEELACLGVQYVLGLGACGSLVGELPQHSLVICRRALPTDGISRAYGATEPLLASARLVEAAEAAAAERGCAVRTATGAGVDALYRETETLIAELRGGGAEVVSLEVSAFYATCAACGVEGLWVGCVSDCLLEGTWQHWYTDLRTVTDQAGRVCRRVLESVVGDGPGGGAPPGPCRGQEGPR